MRATIDNLHVEKLVDESRAQQMPHADLVQYVSRDLAHHLARHFEKQIEIELSQVWRGAQMGLGVYGAPVPPPSLLTATALARQQTILAAAQRAINPPINMFPGGLQRMDDPQPVSSKWIQASDTFELFLSDMQSMGYPEATVRRMPSEMYVQWIVVKQHEAEGQEAPVDLEKTARNLAPAAPMPEGKVDGNPWTKPGVNTDGA